MTTKVSARRSRISLAAITLAFTYTFVVRYLWGTVMSDANADMAINSVQSGLYMTVFFIGYIITQIPAGILADNAQSKNILIIATLVNGITAFLMYGISNYELGLILRFISGLSSGLVFASCSKIIIKIYPPEKRAEAMGVLLASPAIGITISNLIGASVNSSIGWRGAFAVTGLISIFVSLFLLMGVKPVSLNLQTNHEKIDKTQGVKLFFTDKQQLITAMAGFLYMFAVVAYATWSGSYFQNELQYSGIKSSFLITCYSLAAIFGSSLSGKIAKKLKLSHQRFLVFSFITAAVMVIILALLKSYDLLIAVSVIYGLISYLPSTHLSTLAMKQAGDRHSATAASVQNLIFQIASMIQSVLIGKVIDNTNSYYVIWPILFICSSASFLLSLMIRQKEEKETSKYNIAEGENL